jgi:NADP-dependent 3-hydroxy acid dehydrogenase YdfG
VAGESGRSIVVTGASSGIGAALVELLARRGDRVVAVARREDALAEVALRAGGDVLTIVGDMTRRDDVRRVVADSLARWGVVDVWVNNVGRGLTRVPSELTDDDIDSMITVNVKSALYGMQEILPHFRERGRGHVVNVSSILGRIPFAVIRCAYSGAKHFLNVLTANMRDELRETHPEIRFSTVSPGVVRTNFGLNALHGGPDSWKRKDAQSAEEVAALIAGVIDWGRDDVYSLPGQRQRVIDYYESIGEDP